MSMTHKSWVTTQLSQIASESLKKSTTNTSTSVVETHGCLEECFLWLLNSSNGSFSSSSTTDYESRKGNRGSMESLSDNSPPEVKSGKSLIKATISPFISSDECDDDCDMLTGSSSDHEQRFFVGPLDARFKVNFALNFGNKLKKKIENEVAAGKVKDVSETSTRNTNNNNSVPYPCLCGVSFSATGKKKSIFVARLFLL